MLNFETRTPSKAKKNIYKEEIIGKLTESLQAFMNLENINISFIAVIIGALEMVPKALMSRMEELGIQEKIEIVDNNDQGVQEWCKLNLCNCEHGCVIKIIY